MNKNLANERLIKYGKLFENVLADLEKFEMTNYEAENFEDKVLLYKMLLKSNIHFENNAIVEASKTYYDIDRRILYLNTRDSQEEVDYAILKPLFDRLLSESKIKSVKTQVTAMIITFKNLGLIYEHASNQLPGTDEEMVERLIKLFINSNK